MLDKVLLVLLGTLLGALGYMFKRRLERKPTLEQLDVHAKLLSINKELKAQSLTPQDLTNLEKELTDKPKAVQKNTQQLEQNAQPLLEKSEGEFLSQAEMNIRAGNNFEVAKLKMTHVFDESKLLLGEPEKSALVKAQAAWESYCVEQAEASAASYQGGSIWSLIYLSELERLTVERTARLQADLDAVRKLGI